MDNENPNINKYQKIEDFEEIKVTEEAPEEGKKEKKGRHRKDKKEKKSKEIQTPAVAEEKSEETQVPDIGEEIQEDFPLEDVQHDDFDGIDISKYLSDDAEEESLDDILKSVAIMENGGDKAEIRDIYADLQEPSDPDADITEQEKDITETTENVEREDNNTEDVVNDAVQTLSISEVSESDIKNSLDGESVAEETQSVEPAREDNTPELDETINDSVQEESTVFVEGFEKGTVPTDKKAKKEKKTKEKKVKEKKEKVKKEKEPLGPKDYVTIVLALVALFAVAIFAAAYFKGIIGNQPNVQRTILQENGQEDKLGDILRRIFGKKTNDVQETTTQEDKLADVQIVRSGTMVDLVQSDIPDVFYGVTSDYKVKYFQYYEGEVHAVLATNNISLKVDLGSATVPVRINYAKLGGRVFGFGLFTAEEDSDVYFYDMVAFKITDLPEKYRKEGHALLLATSDKNALTSNNIKWTESFDLNLETGETTRFLKIINRRMDNETGRYENNFCLLSRAGYTSESITIPFFTAREYPLGVEDMQDIFVKTGETEKLLASDVYGRFCLVDNDTIIYMRKTTTGFNVIYNKGGKEEVGSSFYGFMNSSYINYREFILSKADGKLYNLLNREEKTLVGYSMSNPDYFCVSDDGKYLVVIGTVKNALDYQVQMFNLETGEYAKMEDKNFSLHSNLCFINEKTAAYCVVDPNKGFECVVLDLEKAFD